MWSRAVGVGHIPVRAIVSSDGLTVAPSDADWFDPYDVAAGVGNITAAIASTNDPLDPFARNRSAISGGVGAELMDTGSAVGVGYICTIAPSDGEWRVSSAGLPLILWSTARGVGHDEDAVAEVRGTDGGRRDAVPLTVVPELGQISEYSSEPQGKVPWHVLQQCPFGS